MKNSCDVETIMIGKQVWQVKNLAVTRFRNGDEIPEIKNVEDWRRCNFDSQPAWCYFGNNPEYEKYGKLYNWYAVTDKRGLAPRGFHIPELSEWNMLVESLEGRSIAGKLLKSNTGWAEKNPAKKVCGFNALPGGARSGNGTYYEEDIERLGHFWTATEHDKAAAFCTWIKRDDNFLYTIEYSKGMGLSVRCIKS